MLQFIYNYIKIFKLKGYCDKHYVKLDSVKVGKYLKKLRLINNDSQYTLADKIKISRQAVSKWERFETIPSKETLIRISDLYNVSIDKILRGGKE